MHSRERELRRHPAGAAVTLRVTTLKGPEAGAYYVEALPNYYVRSGEPMGVWHGHGAGLLGLRGEVDGAEFLAVMAGLDPTSGGEQPLGRRHGETSVRGFDLTASAPKGVSTLFALGDDTVRAEVLDAHDTAVRVAVGWIEAHAHTRYRIDGEVAVLDAEGIICAAFRQHTSRVLDPQLHTHIVVANRVRSGDGRWLALDARTLKADQRTLSAIYHQALRSELTARLGLRWEPVLNGIAETADVPDELLDAFSRRTSAMQRRVDEKIDRFEDTFDRRPTPRERWQLEREAAVDSRPSKSDDIDAGTLHAEWNERATSLGLDRTGVEGEAVDRINARHLDDTLFEQVIAAAMAALVERQSTWRPAEITREIAAAIPTDTHLPATQIADTLDHLTDLALATRCVDLNGPVPAGVRLRRDGRPVTESAIHRIVTTPGILAQEAAILDWADQRSATPGSPSSAAVDRAGVDLTGPQTVASAAVAGDAELVLIVGPAGTGKTTALAPAVADLQARQRAVFGTAPSAAAAEVLATETAVAADTIDKLLVEHASGRPAARYDLPAGATLLVDEAAMVDTDRLHQLTRLADAKRWRVVLVGDPLQFSAVGRGGMFAHLIDTHDAIELDRVHRFTNDWERDASLRLRRGDTTVAALYDHHGRIHGGTATRMRSKAIHAWWAARTRGETVLLTAPTNDTVAELNDAAQQRRVRGGDLDTTGPCRTTPTCRIWVGDDITTRRNDRQLRTDRGHMIRNRDTWTVTAIHPNGDLTATGPSGTVRLPAAYVEEHVELGYAQTCRAAQGRTVDRSILYLDTTTDTRGLYVAMTRGRHDNTAYIATPGETTALDLITDAIKRSWIDEPAHTHLTSDAHPGGPIEPLAGEELLRLLTPGTTTDGKQVSRILAADRAARARRIRHNPPSHILQELGPRPTEPAAASAWDQQAGHAEQRRTILEASRCRSQNHRAGRRRPQLDRQTLSR